VISFENNGFPPSEKFPMDTLRDFHRLPPWMSLSLVLLYHDHICCRASRLPSVEHGKLCSVLGCWCPSQYMVFSYGLILRVMEKGETINLKESRWFKNWHCRLLPGLNVRFLNFALQFKIPSTLGPPVLQSSEVNMPSPWLYDRRRIDFEIWP